MAKQMMIWQLIDLYEKQQAAFQTIKDCRKCIIDYSLPSELDLRLEEAQNSLSLLRTEIASYKVMIIEESNGEN